jgi:hypothetical protein
MTVQPPQEGFC